MYFETMHKTTKIENIFLILVLREFYNGCRCFERDACSYVKKLKTCAYCRLATAPPRYVCDRCFPFVRPRIYTLQLIINSIYFQCRLVFP